MEELREFRGYVGGKLEHKFPLHWVDSIKWLPIGIEVVYEDEFKYNFDTIYVDEINIK